MADQPLPEGSQAAPFVLTASNIVGIIQRVILELNIYLTQPAEQIDPRRCLAFLEEAARFVGKLPPPPSHPANGNQQPNPGARKPN